jgi:hypothetical protein
LVDALAIVLLVCFGVRAGAWLVEPILPALGVLVVLAIVALWLIGGPHDGGRW